MSSRHYANSFFFNQEQTLPLEYLLQAGLKIGGPSRIRTCNQGIMSPLL